MKFFAPSDLLFNFNTFVPAGQRHIVDSGRQESHERCRLHRQVFIRRIDQVHATRNRFRKFYRLSCKTSMIFIPTSISSVADRRLEDESAGEEAAGATGKA